MRPRVHTVASLNRVAKMHYENKKHRAQVIIDHYMMSRNRELGE